MQTFQCPHCGSEFQYPEDQAGGVVTCLGCGRGVTLPAIPRAGGAARAERSSGFWGKLTGWVGWLPLAAILIAAGLVWLTVLRRGDGPTRVPVKPMALMTAGFAVLILWFVAYYFRLTLDRRRERRF
jgi:hypothetical protein